jgi:hypothetical protein
VRTRVDARLAEQASRFALRFACDDCVHFGARGTAPAAPEATCGHGWPVRLRRSALDDEELSFCKEYELA